MIDFGHLEAIRFCLDWRMDQEEEFPEQKVKYQKSENQWLVSIVRESYELSKFTRTSVNEAIKNYHRQIRTESETAGRLIDPANPVQISGGVLNSIKLKDEVEPQLNGFEDRIEQFGSEAVFGGHDEYEELAKAGLNYSRTILPRIRLFIHTYLWILWTHEALHQANRFGANLQSEHRFESFTTAAFPYIAHPPLIVATIACTTMIEEVGAEYINSYIDGKDYDRDHTSASSILTDLENKYAASDDFDINSIRSQVVESRDDVSHYVTKRDDVVNIDDFEEFYNSVIEGIELVDELLGELISRPTARFYKQIDEKYN
ncbi:hypothetical protein [Halorarum salinum]|uniref:Uncharacterized protein n=1 Tax=Halorarum salinum TaxID=2743089 RepID=A0A7D5LD46_9EURY|nr:hypothetical protein [Halobaculum salinum]QLG63734.1 hypothetical protein HUG12_19195 [Halobaculum salinum]